MGDFPRFEVAVRGVAEADLVVLPVFEGPSIGPGGSEIALALDIDLAEIVRRNPFSGKDREVLALPGLGGGRRSLLLVGLGSETSANTAVVRHAAMRAGAAARPHRIVATTLPQVGDLLETSTRAFVEGFLLGGYRFDRYRTAAEPALIRKVRLLVPPEARGAARRAIEKGVVTAIATNWARDLVNAPASDATPAALADEARRMARDAGITCRVWTRAALERGGFGGIVGVGRGSANEPRMVELAYRGAGRATPIALTGKGVTFDSGGLSLKKPAEMAWMRSDMAGGAAALAVIRAAAELQLKVNVVAAVPFAENVPGSKSIRPGDVVRHRGGRTSEVVDTDAEGRVLLADVLAYLSERRPAAIIDSATLTDAAGLGADLWAVMGTDSTLVADLLEAGAEAGEPGWELPLWTPYRKLIDSSVADVKNLGDHGIDNSMMAGLFLKDFVPPDVPWAHLDTGSSAWAEHVTDLWPEGATGSPTRAFLRYLERRADTNAV